MSKLLLLIFAFASLEGPARGGNLLAKPARVPFTDEDKDAVILVHASVRIQRQCQDLFVHIADDGKLLESRTHIGDIATSHTDQFGLQWMHVSVDLRRLPLGATTVGVTLCGAAVFTKVVKAQLKERLTYTVDNIRGKLLDPNGFAFILFGSYIYGVTTEVERAVPEAEIPFGMNWIGPYLSEAKGHTNETWTTILAFLDRCEEMGVHVHYDLHQLATLPDTPSKWQLMETEIKTVMNHPAVAAYYLADEPGGNGIDPALLEKAYDFVKGVDPNRPITEVFCCVDPAKYINSFDIGMADPYPIPTSSPFIITVKVNQLIATGKPFFIVVQSFGGGEIWERQPTPAEERAMTYIAMLTGAIGIQYFVRSPGQFPYAETSWSECRRLSLEFRELSSAILIGGPRVNVTPSISQILATGWGERVNGTWVVAAVNVENSPVTLPLPPRRSLPARRALFPAAVDVVARLPPLGATACVKTAYRFPPIKSTQVNPANLLANPSFEQVTSPSGPDGAYLNVPADHGSTYLTDTRFSVDGLHSLQLTTPTKGQGFTVEPFNIRLDKDTEYELTFWAVSRQANLTLLFSFSDLTPASATFQTSTEWSKYSASLTATATTDRVDAVNYQLVSAGTVWIDLLQLIPSP
ncbi:hypothetical protein GBAR_LOCUS28892 [Geodia barretti]|uniref:CBM-cenC domain-containing protein n=1 Tax=Geodia barretti TaxID=519541 RepID=A0AA35TQX3_GEOBA|nr:hypothetical protein GBAR_LOCUS28892 [Geodia barretti]